MKGLLPTNIRSWLRPQWLQLVNLLGGVLLLLALTGFFFKSQGIDIAQHDQMLGELRRLQGLESTLKADVLRTRFSIDPNYDRLTFHSDQLRLNLLKLKQTLPKVLTRDRLKLQTQFQEIETILADQTLLIERFKSCNAILQNSLRYFPLIAQTSLDQIAQKSPTETVLKAELESLLKSLLIYNLNARESLKPQIEATLSQLELAQASQSKEIQAKVANVLVHGRAILLLKPELAEMMTEIMELPVTQTLDRFTHAYETTQTKVLQEAGAYRWFLYGNCLLLLGFVLWLYRVRYRAKLLKAANANLEQTVHDRTETLRQTLVDLRESQVQLIHAEKMAGLGQLVAGIAHEINNPVSFIYGNIAPAQSYVTDLMELLARYQRTYPQATAEIQDYLEEIDWEFAQTDLQRALTSMQTGAERIREIVLSLRNFSRLDESDKKYANLNEGVESTLLLLQHRLKAQPDRASIHIQTELGQLPKILCHPGQINQVLMNLLVNAIDALEEAMASDPQFYRSPQIKIQTQIIGPKANDVAANNLAADGLETESSVVVEISDNGVGMSEEIQSKLFDPFFTTKPVGKGTGLGMSISYQIIVERHSGMIRCESVLGQGTKFVIELPA